MRELEICREKVDETVSDQCATDVLRTLQSYSYKIQKQYDPIEEASIVSCWLYNEMLVTEGSTAGEALEAMCDALIELTQVWNN